MPRWRAHLTMPDAQFQQNLNHYNPGWPGYLDVSWGVCAAVRRATRVSASATSAIYPDARRRLRSAVSRANIRRQFHDTLRAPGLLGAPAGVADEFFGGCTRPQH